LFPPNNFGECRAFFMLLAIVKQNITALSSPFLRDFDRFSVPRFSRSLAKTLEMPRILPHSLIYFA
jgi:hypothetical protein